MTPQCDTWHSITQHYCFLRDAETELLHNSTKDNPAKMLWLHILNGCPVRHIKCHLLKSSCFTFSTCRCTSPDLYLPTFSFLIQDSQNLQKFLLSAKAHAPHLSYSVIPSALPPLSPFIPPLLSSSLSPLHHFISLPASPPSICMKLLQCVIKAQCARVLSSLCQKQRNKGNKGPTVVCHK